MPIGLPVDSRPSLRASGGSSRQELALESMIVADARVLSDDDARWAPGGHTASAVGSTCFAIAPDGSLV